MHFYRRTVTDSSEELARAIPGANFHCVADAGPSFGGRYWHLHLDGVVLSRLEVDQASVLTVDERVPDFSVWHVMSPRCSANGRDVGSQDVVMVRPGEGGTMRSAGDAHVATFGLEASLFREAPGWELPFGPSNARRSGRWHVASVTARRRFNALNRTMLAELNVQPQLLKMPATRTTLRNALVEAIMALGESGTFRPDRAAVGRHTKIMARFERMIEEAGDAPIDMLQLCRRSGTSRRSLEAVVQLRTGRSPQDYLRWRRLWRAREMLRRPAEDTTVTDVAFRLGFWHLSRFAAAYASAFGERPSTTLAQASGSTRHGTAGGLARNG